MKPNTPTYRVLQPCVWGQWGHGSWGLFPVSFQYFTPCKKPGGCTGHACV